MSTVNVFDRMFFIERLYRIGIFRTKDNSYEAISLNDDTDFANRILVKEIRVPIPRSYIQGLGEKLFNDFVAKAFKTLSMPSCKNPAEVFPRLKRFVEKIRTRLLKYITAMEAQFADEFRKHNRTFNKNKLLYWFRNQVLQIAHSMWVTSKKEHQRIVDRKAWKTI